MRQLICLACLLGLEAPSAVQSAVPASKAPSTQSIEQLIGQLGSRDFRAREQAGKTLVALGRDALPILLKNRSHPDPEVRRRLEELIPPMERTVALTPKLISLHVNNKPISAALNEIARQSGYKITTQASPQSAATGNASYTFHFDRLPFWEAFDKVCEAGGLVTQNSGDDGLNVIALDSYEPYVCHQGRFKVVATGFNYNRYLEMSQLPRSFFNLGSYNQEYLQLSLSIASEPRVPILVVGQVRLSRARDEEDHSMLANGGDEDSMPFGGMRFRRYYRYYNRGNMQYTQIPLLWAAKNCRTLKTIKGKIPVTLLTDQKPTLVTDKLLSSKGKKFKIGTTTFVVDGVSGGNTSTHQIQLSITEENSNPRDYSRIQSMQQRIEIQDAKGKKLPFRPSMTRFTGAGNAQFTFMLPRQGSNVGAPARLIYNAWVLMEHEIAFEFMNLPLP